MGNIMLLLMVVFGFTLAAIFTRVQIPIIKKKQFGQYIREEGPQSHLKKSGTPTMGGLSMVAALVILAAVMKFSKEILVVLIPMLLYGGIGFLDDYIKVAAKHNLGLRGWQKIVLQVFFGASLAIYIARFSELGTKVFIPFYGDYVDFGMLYIPFVTFVMVAMANSVNLTDGLDGLCSGVTAVVSFFFLVIGAKTGNTECAMFCAALAGACLGFLLHNRYPAKIFMGDTGSMALGGGLAAAAVVMKMEFLLVIAGLIYVIEALSVIIQVVSFKATGKRVFKMAPIHHHFEMCGMKEQKVVVMFWGFTFICCVAAYFVFLI